MKCSFVIVGFIIVVSFIFGCESPKDEIFHNIKALEESPISIPYDQMLYWTKDSMQGDSIKKHADMKLVVYMDSNECTECAFERMHLWDDFVKMEDKYNKRFQVLFIVESSEKSPIKAIASAFCYFKLKYPMYIDSTNAFSSKNPHIPLEEMYHVFLLDEKDSVVLVGNPQFNPDIENRLLGILEQKLN